MKNTGYTDPTVDYGKDTGGLAINPNTKQFWITNDGLDRGVYPLNHTTGEIGSGTSFNPSQVDAETLEFADDGIFYTESDEGPSVDRYVWEVSSATGNIVRAAGPFPGVGDVEGMACNAGASSVTSVPSTTANITGTIFEDINYGGGTGRDYTTANTSYAAATIGTEATVELWHSDGAQCLPQPNGSKPPKNEPIQTTTSDPFDGSYSFNSVTGTNFCVRVVNNTVKSKLTLVNGSNTPIPVQTFRTESVDGSAAIASITSEVGGRSPLDVDVPAGIFDNTSGDGSIAQSWSVVNISGGDVSGIDFGFNFDTIVNTNDAGQGSLRQFIINANTFGDEANLAQAGQTTGREVSIFMLPNGTSYSGMKASAGNAFSSGVATINLQSELPDVFRSKLDIDALTQTGAACDRPIIELNGASAGTGTTLWGGSGTSGINIRRDDHNIRGLIINRFAANGIELFRDAYPSASDSSDNTHIECNWIGLDRSGTSAQGNGTGIGLWGMNSFIGDGSDSGRNVISGNTLDGIMNGGGGSLNNTIRGNYIGTNVAGTSGVGNSRHGIHYYNSTGRANGTFALVEGNLIAFNGSVGIAIAATNPSSRNIRLKQNTIHSNRALGIDLVSSGMDAPEGPTINDNLDADSAFRPNGLQNYPTITSVTQTGTNIDISGTLNSKASKDFEIELYSNQVCNADSTGSASTDTYGEGEHYLTTLSITTDASGTGSFSTTVPFASLNGTYLSALAANVTSGDAEEGNTSEFSACTSVTSCTALTGEVTEAVLAPVQLRAGNKVFVASSTITNNAKEGHLRAYVALATGELSSTVSWDAADEMSTPERSTRLYSTNSAGNLVTLGNMDDEAFAINGLPDKSTVVGYTLNPSHTSGIYLNGRATDSFLGSISTDSDIVHISRKIDPWNYLNYSGYRSFYESTIQTRTERVLVTSDDGFLYAFDQNDGDLAWGWMPRSLVSELADHQTFQDKGLMRGHIDLLNLADNNGNYASYVVGSYRSGLGQFVLKLDSSSTSKSDLGSVIWDVDETVVNALVDASPNNGKRAYFADSNGKTYTAFIITSDGSSYLKIRSLTDTSIDYSILLNYTATSAPYVISDFGSRNAPGANTLYLGDANGNIYAAELLTSGALKSESALETALNATAISAIYSSNSSPVLFIGSVASSNGGYYLRAQSKDRLTLLKYVSSSWQRSWTTTTGSSGKWDSSQVYSADSNIQSLASNARIDDEASIVGGSIVLPVSTEPSGSNCYRNAYYYLYKIEDGTFPTNRFYSTDNSVISSVVTLGKGEAKTLQLSDFANGKLLGFGLSDQKPNGSVGINKTLYIKDSITSGIRSWREIR